MKNYRLLSGILLIALLLSACGTAPTFHAPTAPAYTDATAITLSDGGITVDGNGDGVYTANDIIYYESGKDFTYGEGTQQDAHTAEEAAAHTVVHITQPGVYKLSGKLSLGQIAVDLGKDAKKDPSAVVTLVLNGVDITCQVAPAVIFYNVYECGNDDPDLATADVDTSRAGANVIIADGSTNYVRGSYVARIYDPDTVELNDKQTEVEDAKKLHKYDGAFYSRMSLNIFGEAANTGLLNIIAENEGLDSEMHLSINGGHIYIESGNDGINTNEDGISVTTVNGGDLVIRVTGQTGEGDGIDSNGYLVINGGSVMAAACGSSMDAGIDSDLGIHIRGGTVIATGNMLDRLEDDGQTYAVFQFAQSRAAEQALTLKDKNGTVVMEHGAPNPYSVLVYSSPVLTAGSYTLWCDGQQLAGQGSGFGGPGGMPPGGMEPSQGEQAPGGMEPSQGEQAPGGMEPPTGDAPPSGENPPQRPEQDRPDRPGNGPQDTGKLTAEFTIKKGSNQFSGITNKD